jgi:hypothetical protein
MRHPDPGCPQDRSSLEFASRKGSVAWVSMPERIKADRQEPVSLGSLPTRIVACQVLGIVYAADEESALAVMIVERNVRPVDQKQLFACLQ